MSVFRSYRKESKIDWGTECDGPISCDQLKTGALLRLADAAEKMAINHAELINRVEGLKNANNSLRDQLDRRDKAISSLRGQITKLKKRLP